MDPPEHRPPGDCLPHYHETFPSGGVSTTITTITHPAWAGQRLVDFLPAQRGFRGQEPGDGSESCQPGFQSLDLKKMGIFLSPWARDTSSKDEARKSPHSQLTLPAGVGDPIQHLPLSGKSHRDQRAVPPLPRHLLPTPAPHTGES